MEAAVKESARQTRLLVRQYMGEARVEVLNDVSLPGGGHCLAPRCRALLEGNALGRCEQPPRAGL